MLLLSGHNEAKREHIHLTTSSYLCSFVRQSKKEFCGFFCVFVEKKKNLLNGVPSCNSTSIKSSEQPLLMCVSKASSDKDLPSYDSLQVNTSMPK